MGWWGPRQHGPHQPQEGGQADEDEMVTLHTPTLAWGSSSGGAMSQQQDQVLWPQACSCNRSAACMEHGSASVALLASGG